MTIHNLDGVKMLRNLGFERVVLSRELSLNEIKYIRENFPDIELEVFIHGALCISYSGQCLLSSMIGGRSGNRGLCAQPCRLPYELCEENRTTKETQAIDKGYLLSPRDNCGLEYLPELIKLGINSFKIEGRMKTPTYVATVTRIYRKYIDLVLANINLDNTILKQMIFEYSNKKNPETNLSDKEELMQVFNRGGFSTGHFNSSGNKNLIFKDKPNNMGFLIGTISHINENKGHLKVKLENTLSIGDKVSINNESYTVSELMIDNKNFTSLNKGNIVKIGRMKGRLSVGNKIYKIEDSKLNKFIAPTFKEDKELKKIPILGEIIIKENHPISLKVWSDTGFYKGLEFSLATSLLPSKALNKPLSKGKVLEQITKTGNTEFEFKGLRINLDDNLFIQMSILNDLRRNALIGLENLVIKEYTRNIHIPEININTETSSKSINYSNISLLLNIIDKNFDYSKLNGINRIYVPLKYFSNKDLCEVLLNISKTYNLFIYMPHVLKDYYINSINFEKIISKFNIKGFVISHISQIENLKKYNLKLIGNFNLNIYNKFSIAELNSLSTITVSPELDKFETNNLFKFSNLENEIIVYGKLPVMTNNYCYLGKSNKCHGDCTKRCSTNNKYYLKDRMNFKFRIIPDNTQGITTIFNSKTLSIVPSEFETHNFRIDIIDETIEEIQNIIDTVKSNSRFEGKDFTNGNY